MDDDARAEDPWTPMALPAWISVGVGALALGRVGLELYQCWGLYQSPGFFVVIAVETILAFCALVAGIRLLRRRAGPLVAMAASAITVHCAGTLLLVGDILARSFLLMRGSTDFQVWGSYAATLVLLIVQVLWWPLLLGLVYVHLVSGGALSRKRFWIGASTGMILCGIVQVALRLSGIN